MIMTVVTQDGALQAAAAGDVRAPWVTKQQSTGLQAGLTALPGQTVHVVEVPDKYGSMVVADPAGLMSELSTVLRQRGLL
jgi:hypothetical protein